MSGISRTIRVAPLLAILIGLSAGTAAFAAEADGNVDAGAVPTETDAEKRWFDSQGVAPLPGETQQPADEENAERVIELNEDAVVETVQTPRIDLPAVLKPADAELYRQIFELQDKARWKQADALIRKLGDDVLLGHVYFQRYMHPTAYRTSYKEMLEWLDKYADHPGAEQVYKLALKRRPKNWRHPNRPQYVRPAAKQPSRDS